VGNFNTHLSPIDRSFQQKINNEILELNDAIDQMDLTDVYRIFHLTTRKYTPSQQLMEHSPKLIILGEKQASANIRKWK
jgi:hypothetical protein